MSERADLRRNSPVMIPIRLAESVAVIVPTAFAWLSIRTRWPVWFGVSVDAIVLTLAVLAVAGLVFEWWFTRFAVDPTGVTYRKGLLVQRAVSLGWDEVVSVQVSRSAVARALGCSKVVVGVGSESRTQLVIDAVAPRTATEFEARFAHSRAAVEAVATGLPATSPDGELAARPDADTGPAGSAPSVGDVGGELLYRIRPRDFLVLSVTYGQFVLVAPFLFGLYDNVADVLSLSDTALVLPHLTLPVPVLVVVVLLGALPAAVVFGVGVAWLRFRGFEVHRRDGVYTMTGGLLSAESRQVSRSQVEGLKIQQNPVMRATGYARLRFVSRQSGDRIGSNIVFPSVRLSSVRQDLVREFPGHATALERATPVPSPVAWLLGLLDAAVLAVVLLGLRGAPPAFATLVVLCVAVLLLVLTNYCWAGVAVDEAGFLCYRRGFIWVTHYAVPFASVYFAESYAVVRSRDKRGGLLCLGIYDSRPVRLWAPIGTSAAIDQVVAASADR